MYKSYLRQDARKALLIYLKGVRQIYKEIERGTHREVRIISDIKLSDTP